MKVQMWGNRIAGVSYQRDLLSHLDFVAALEMDTFRLQVCVECITMLSEIEDDGVAISLFQGDMLGKFARSLLGKTLDHCSNDRIGHSEYRFAKDGIAFKFFARARVDAIVGVELFPVDRITLGQIHFAVYRKSRARMSRGIAA